MLARLARIVYTARVVMATVNYGQGVEFWVVAGVVVGGTSMSGGVGGVGKTIFGVLIITILQTGMLHLHVPSFTQQVATGALLVVAFLLRFYSEKSKGKAKGHVTAA